MTLVEVLVVCALLSLMFSVVAAVLQPGLAAWRRSDVRADLQANVLQALHALSQAIEQAHSRDVEIVTHGGDDASEERADALVISNATPQGSPGIEVYYLRPETRELWHAHLEVADGGLPAPLRASLEEGRGVPPHYGVQRVVARLVHLFAVGRDKGPFTLRLETRDRGSRCEARSAVTPVLDGLGQLPEVP